MRRVGTAIATVLVALATAAPSVAAPRHDLTVYRVAQAVTLDEGQTGTYTLACRGRDVVTDGVWRIESVDVDPALDDQPYDLVTGVDALAAEAFSDSAYRFTMHNNAEGGAQVHFAVSCLAARTRPAGAPGHRHGLVVTGPHATTSSLMPGPGSTPDIVCPADAIAIAPGFRSGGGLARLVGRYPGVPNLGRLGTELSVLAPGSVTSSVRCLARETTRAGGHRDRLKITLRGSDTAVRAGRVERPSVECSPRESAIVGAFRLTGAWYLGQNARGRNRTFKLQAATPLVAGQARLAALCLSLRTVPA